MCNGFDKSAFLISYETAEIQHSAALARRRLLSTSARLCAPSHQARTPAFCSAKQKPPKCSIGSTELLMSRQQHKRAFYRSITQSPHLRLIIIHFSFHQLQNLESSCLFKSPPSGKDPKAMTHRNLLDDVLPRRLSGRPSPSQSLPALEHGSVIFRTVWPTSSTSV